MGYPPAGVTPPPPLSTGQQMEYLIRCGRYASCIYEGGLSCSRTFLWNMVNFIKHLNHYIILGPLKSSPHHVTGALHNSTGLFLQGVTKNVTP